MNRSPRSAGFTLIEMITVIAIIVILVSLVVAVNGLVQTKAAKTRTDNEIHLLSQACEAYRTDNGGYPQDNWNGTNSFTNTLDPTISGSPTSYMNACGILYQCLSGDTTNAGSMTKGSTNYAPDFFKPSRMAGKTGTGATPPLYVMDPYGNAYGYSTAGLKAEQEYQQNLATAPGSLLNTQTRSVAGVQYTVPTNSLGFSGFNTTFDMWSTGGTSSGSTNDRAKWMKNW